MHSITIPTPIGLLRIHAGEQGVTLMERVRKGSSAADHGSQILQEAKKQLIAYFHGKRTQFDLPFDLQGTAFQKKVWKVVARIPYGHTITYGDIAKRIGSPLAVRAVGTAVGKTPLCIVIPCHRVIPTSGDMGQYALGKQAKKWLLDHESKIARDS